jgi:xanthine dehydrogenase accessory factor
MNTNLTALVSTFHDLRQQHDELVLATIIETLGSTYRKAGARMLITPDAKFFGLLGGGCFEADLLAHAQDVFDKRQSKIVFYDMRAPEDEIWGLGLGCNGAVRILMQLLSTKEDEHAITLIERALNEKQKQVLLTICESNHTDLEEGQNHLLKFEDETPLDPNNDWPEEIIKAAKRTYLSESSLLTHYQAKEQSITFFCSEIKPPWHLLIIGAGPDAAPVIRFAKGLGWEISLVDYRESFIKQDSFAEVDHTIMATPEELPEQLDLHQVDAIILMTHKIEYDERYLKQLTQTSAKYIGLLGPAARRDRLIACLGEDEKLIHDRIFGPVGLDIGGELPEEIALSLVAEVQATLYQRDGGPLHKKTTALHDQQDFSNKDLHAVVLAAGGAKRFGGLKQLLEYKGTSLLRRSIDTANKIVDERVWVILGARSHKVKRNIENLDTRIVINKDWESGIASSIKAGVDVLPDSCTGVLFVLCDQALITQEHLQQLCELWLNDKSKIVASTYADTVGVPLIIPRNYFSAIMKLKGDVGAKSIITKYAEDIVTVNIPEAECDIDTESDYMALLSK